MSKEPFQDSIADSCSKNHKVQARWELMFEKLKEYKQEHGNCLVPNRYEKDRSLGSWVSTQRRYFKLMRSSKCSNERQKFHIDKNRIAKLQDIGFNWVATDPRRTPWETRFRELCEYKEQFGNVVVPIGYKGNIQLANWVSTQRQAYKAFLEGSATSITQEKIWQLESLGMVWDAKKGNCKSRECKVTADNIEDQQTQRFASFVDIKNKETSDSVEVPKKKKSSSTFLGQTEKKSRESIHKDIAIMSAKGLSKNKLEFTMKHSKKRMGAINDLEPHFENIHKRGGDSDSLFLNSPSVSVENKSNLHFTWKSVSNNYSQTKGDLPKNLNSITLHELSNYSFNGQETGQASGSGNPSLLLINTFHVNNVKKIKLKPLTRLKYHIEQESLTPRPPEAFLAEALKAGYELTAHLAAESVDQLSLFLETMSWTNNMNILMALSNEHFLAQEHYEH